MRIEGIVYSQQRHHGGCGDYPATGSSIRPLLTFTRSPTAAR